MLVDYVRVYGHDGAETPDLHPFCLDVFHEPPCETMFLADDATRFIGFIATRTTTPTAAMLTRVPKVR